MGLPERQTQARSSASLWLTLVVGTEMCTPEQSSCALALEVLTEAQTQSLHLTALGSTALLSLRELGLFHLKRVLKRAHKEDGERLFARIRGNSF